MGEKEGDRKKAGEWIRDGKEKGEMKSCKKEERKGMGKRNG